MQRADHPLLFQGSSTNLAFFGLHPMPMSDGSFDPDMATKGDSTGAAKGTSKHAAGLQPSH